MSVRLQVVSPEVVRVSVSPDGKFHDRQSLAVLPQKECADFTVSKESSKVVLTTSALSVEVSKADGTVQFFKADGTPLALDGHAAFDPLEVEGKKAWSTTVSYASTDDEAFYGLGQHQEGFMNYRGKELLLSQSNVNAINPVLVSNKGYGIFWDNYSLTKFDNQNADTLKLWSEMGDNVDYYFFAANNIDGAIAEYRSLTGKAQNLPLWAFGYWQSKERYQTQQEVVDVANRYQKDGDVGLDVMVQDWEWWKPGHWSGMSFDSTRYPNPKQMTESLHKMGVVEVKRDSRNITICILNLTCTPQKTSLETLGAPP